MTIDLESLRCFEAAATLLNFRSAAKKVALSPAAFSDRIRRLESFLDVQLFQRTTRKITLTSHGLRLLPQARRCLFEANLCKVITQDQNTVAPMAITIGTRYELGLSWLLPLVSEIEKQFPGLTIHLTFGSSDALITKVLRGQIDGAITSSSFSNHKLAYIPLHAESYTLLTSPQLAVTPTPQGLCQHRLLDIDASQPLFRYFQDHRGGPDPWRFQKYRYLGTIAAIREMLLLGEGVAVLPTYFVQDDIRKGRLVEIYPEQPIQSDFFRFIYLVDQLNTQTLTRIANLLSEAELQ